MYVNFKKQKENVYKIKKLHEVNKSCKYEINSLKLNISKFGHSKLNFNESISTNNVVPTRKLKCLNCNKELSFMLKTCKSDHFELR